MALQFNPYPLEPYLNKIKSEQDNAAMVPNAIAGGLTNAFNAFMQARQQGAERERQKKLDELMKRKNQREEDESFIRWGTRDKPQIGLEYQKLFKENQDSNPWAPISGVLSKNNKPILYNKSTNQVMEAPIEATIPSLIKDQAKAEAGNEKLNATYGLYETARDGLLAGLEGTNTGYIAGKFPAITANQQVAEGAVAAMAPVLKQLFRVAGEGVFTDRDQALLLAMIPTRGTDPKARAIQIKNIDNIVKAKLGQSTGIRGGINPTPSSRQSATNPRTGEKLYSDDGGQTWHR